MKKKILNEFKDKIFGKTPKGISGEISLKQTMEIMS